MLDLDTLIAQLADTLRARGLRLATAESCTGGLVAGACTHLAGSSDWFERGFVTYSNEAKTEMLGVPHVLIREHGAVSEPVVHAMAVGALQHSRADLVLAITGVAGPGGGSTAKPVGTVWLGWGRRPRQGGALQVDARCEHFAGDRGQVRAGALLVGLAGVLERAALG
jgi:nicotinamide-nucleotide amidase